VVGVDASSQARRKFRLAQFISAGYQIYLIELHLGHQHTVATRQL
jgi:hypothetical protein